MLNNYQVNLRPLKKILSTENVQNYTYKILMH